MGEYFNIVFNNNVVVKLLVMKMFKLNNIEKSVIQKKNRLEQLYKI